MAKPAVSGARPKRRIWVFLGVAGVAVGGLLAWFATCFPRGGGPPLELSAAGRPAAEAARGGFDGAEFVYWRDGAPLRGPLTCDLLSRLLREALAPARGSGFVWQVCDPTPRPGILAWQAADFAIGGVPVSRAAFYYERPEVDWPALAGPRRLTVLAAKGATAEFRVRNDALAAFLETQNRDLRNIHIETTAEQFGVSALACGWFGLKIPVAAAGRFALEGRRLLFHPDAAKVWRFNAPKFLLRRLDRWLNPVAEIDLSAWALEPVAVRLLPAPTDAVAINAQSGATVGR
jgi:hypothetical protein